VSAVLRRVRISGGAIWRADRRSETCLCKVGSDLGGAPHRAAERRQGSKPVADARSSEAVARPCRAAAATPSAPGVGRQRKPGRTQPPQTPPTAPPKVLRPKRGPAWSREGEAAASSKENRDSGGQLVRVSRGQVPVLDPNAAEQWRYCAGRHGEARRRPSLDVSQSRRPFVV
jgi:hypothetical protein